MILDYFRLAVRSLQGRSLRTWLTMIGIFIGITAVVSLVSLGNGLQDSINKEFEKIGKNRIMITPGSGQFGPEGGQLSVGKMTVDDLEAVRKVKGVDIASGVISKTAKVQFKEETEFTSVWGFDTDRAGDELIRRTSFLDILQGRQLKNGDLYKAVVGYNIAYDMFKKDLRIGDTIIIEGIDFKVVGIQKKAGNPGHDNLIRIPMEVAREVYSMPDEISTIFALSSASEPPSSVAERITRTLRRFRNVKDGEEDFSVQTAEQMINSLNTILSVVTIFVAGIAAISLLVGGIGIMNTMYTTVLERTREIGIMKSIGAKNSQIMFLFLAESGILGLAGGAVGIVLGFIISKAGQFVAVQLGAAFFQSSFTVFLIAGALMFSFFIGMASGILPARQASTMPPVEALRR